jgi:DNA-directed RNA polymerase subunit RPC12/RpoP
MRKFCCAHCGHRLAVPPRHLDKLVTCPECGKSTHPLACEILSATGVAIPSSAQGSQSPGAGGTASPSPKTEAAPAQVCANCAQPIGKLQKLNLWQNSVVCAACYRRLSKEEPEAAVATAASRAGSARRKADIAGETNLPTHRRKSEPGAASSTLVGIAKVLPGLTALAPADDTNLRTIPMQLRQRALVVLAAVCIGGAAVYGALSLLRDLTGILTSIALVVLAGVIAYLLVQALVAAARRALRRRRAGAKVGGQDVVVVKRES